MLRDVALRVGRELAPRLEAPLSEKDALALKTALLQATEEGAKAGAVEVTAQLDEQTELRAGINLQDRGDPWGEWERLYGDG